MTKSTLSIDVRDRTVFAGFLVTVGLGILFGLVWLDNRAGFQDAGAFADLLAAFFSSVATVWLIVAVVRQGHELGLQREELSLQRVEVTKLTETNALQAELMREELKVARENHWVSQVKQMILSDPKPYEKLVGNLRDVGIKIAEKKCGRGPWLFQRRGFGNKLIDHHMIKKNAKSTSKKSVPVSYEEISEKCDGDARLSWLNEIWAEANSSGSGKWFTKRAAHLIAPVGDLDVYSMSLLLNVAAAKSK